MEEKNLLINSLKESTSSQGDSSDMEREMNSKMKVKEEEIMKMTDIFKEKEESHATCVQQLRSQIAAIESEKLDLIASLEKAKHEQRNVK